MGGDAKRKSLKVDTSQLSPFDSSQKESIQLKKRKTLATVLTDKTKLSQFTFPSKNPETLKLPKNKKKKPTRLSGVLQNINQKLVERKKVLQEKAGKFMKSQKLNTSQKKKGRKSQKVKLRKLEV